MTRYTKVPFFAILFGLIMLPFYVSAASITETTAEIGENCTASGENSTAMGKSTKASGDYSTAMGLWTIAGGNFSFAGGNRMQLTQDAYNTFVWGYAVSPHVISTANAFLIFPAGVEGSVGIGTSEPNELLEVAGDGRAFFGDGEGESRKGLLIDGIHGSGAARLEAYHYGTGGLDLVLNTVGKGNVGIGTSSPGYLLEVAGDAAKSSGGTTWINSSDERLKDITDEYERGLDAILELKPVTFFYKDRNPRGLPSDEENIGFIAQEVQWVFPEAVNEGPDGYLDFNMHPVNVAVINSIKELKAENEALRLENAMLKKDIEKIKAILGI